MLILKDLLFSILLFFCTAYCFTAIGQVVMGSAVVDASAQLKIDSETGGILIPRLSQAERLAIASPATGLLVFETDVAPGFWYFNGNIWVTLTGIGWSIFGDAATDPTSQYVGTNDSNDLLLVANNNEVLRIDNTQNVGINTQTPQSKLHVVGTAPVFRLQDGNEGVSKVLQSDASGNAFWGSKVILEELDDDWGFIGEGMTEADGIYRTGATTIGRTGTTTHNLDVDNGAMTGTTFGIGDVEYILDGDNETIFSSVIYPNFNSSTASLNLGKPFSQRWNEIYAVNGTIQTSDSSLKTQIEPSNYGLETLMKLRPISFFWKEEQLGTQKIPQNLKERQLGLIAQEVELLIPEVVYTYGYRPESEENNEVFIRKEFERIGINYEELLPVLIKAKQEQEEQILRLEQRTRKKLSVLKQLLKSK